MNDHSHKRSKSHHSQYTSHKRVGSVAHYSINFGQNMEGMTIDKEQYRVSPNEAVGSESFDSRSVHKASSLVDNNYHNEKHKAVKGHGVSSGSGKSVSQY